MPLVGATVITVVVMVALAAALIWRAQDQAALAEGRRQNCVSIEALKAEFRKEAIENFKRLDENAELLGIEVTPKLREAARKSRDAKLRRFAPIDC